MHQQLCDPFHECRQVKGFGQYTGCFQGLAVAEYSAFIVTGDEQHFYVRVPYAASVGDLPTVQAPGQADIADQQVRRRAALEVRQRAWAVGECLDVMAELFEYFVDDQAQGSWSSTSTICPACTVLQLAGR